MPDFRTQFTSIAVPSMPADADAQDIAEFNAQFLSNLGLTANSLLLDSLDLKATDFYAVGDTPEVTFGAVKQRTLLGASGPAAFSQSVDNKTLNWTTIASAVEQLSALASPATPSLQTVSTDIPSLDAAAPTVALPTAPSADVGAEPGSAPNITDPSLPDAPSVTLPSVPTFEELNLPAAPSFSLPAWTAAAPQNLVAPPTATFSYVDPGYVSTLHDPLVQKLLGDLQNGSYGIDAGDEQALWFRARDRAAQQARDKVEEAQRRMASTSFPMPQGTMIEAIDQAENEAQKLLSEANREIALRRSELYVEGRKFTIQQVKEYEQVRINLYNATQERALNYSKAVVEMGIAVYDASVRNYQAQLEGYKAEAQVFEQRVRGELAKAELFKAQIEAEKLRADFNRAKLDLYTGQLKAIDTVVELYKSRLSAANVFMQVQAQRLEVYRNQVLVFAERVRAKEAEYNIYQAQIRGELAKLDVYKSQIDAFNARVAGLETKARIQVQSNESLLQGYRASVQQYANQLQQLSKILDGRLDEAKVKGSIYANDIASYRAFVDAVNGGNAVAVDEYRVNLEGNRLALQAAIARVDNRLKQLQSSVELQKSVNVAGLDVIKGALSSAASGLNSLGVASISG